MFFRSREKDESQKENYWQRALGPILGAIVAFILELIQVAFISAAIIIPIRTFLVQPFYVQGASMEPNFFDHEYLLIDEISYRFNEPARGDTLVFRYPRDPSQFFIKRLIGLPGETIEIDDGRVQLFNEEHSSGLVLSEPYLGADFTAGRSRVTLGADEYYVLGDNRDESLDSRSFGPIKREAIIGKVWLRGLPIDRLEIIRKPIYAI